MLYTLTILNCNNWKKYTSKHSNPSMFFVFQGFVQLLLFIKGNIIMFP